MIAYCPHFGYSSTATFPEVIVLINDYTYADSLHEAILFGTTDRRYIVNDFKHTFEKPKWWKWYDIFRTYEVYKPMLILRRLKTINRMLIHSCTTRKAKQKRKTYVQNLYKKALI